jgi:membrane protein required for colicin V production
MYIDILLGLTLILGFLYGFSKGIIKTLFSLVSILIGIIAAMKLSPLTIVALESLIPNNTRLTYIAGFILTFVIVLVLIRFIGNKLEKLMQKTGTNFLNKLMGGSVMAVFFGILYSVIVWFGNEARLISETQKDESFTYYYLEPIPAKARAEVETLKPIFREFWDKTVDTFEKVGEKGTEIQQRNDPQEIEVEDQ